MACMLRRLYNNPLREKQISAQAETKKKERNMITREKSKACNIETPIGGFMSKPMARENNKVKNALIFDLPAITTCPNCEGCKRKCYALVQQKMYDATRAKRELNYYLLLNYPKFMAEQIESQFQQEREKRGKRFFTVRLHASGDFFSAKYVKFWEGIAKNNKDFLFYGYSKAFAVFPELDALNRLENVNIVNSILPSNEINFGSLEYCLKKFDELKKMDKKVVLCPCGIDKSAKCGLTCTKCHWCEYCLIVEHK